ncbi:MAG: hypothetical protein AAGG68_12075 [Bacteroidota bacterium]
MNDKKYPAKLLLFGEYTVILGSRALAMPLPRFFGQWKMTDQEVDDRLLGMLKYIEKEKIFHKQLNINELSFDIKNGLKFDSNIPLGYGLGSSGALCAAIYDQFALEKGEDLKNLKAILAHLENHFHSSSSGVDPLICYLKKATLLEGSDIEVLEQFSLPQSSDNQLFLLDSGFARTSGNLINWFVQQCEKESYKQQIESQLMPTVENSIAALLQHNMAQLFDFLHEISHFQWQYFQPMIPASIQNLWLDGLSSNWFKLKLCGAGGGGFFMGITNDLKRLQHYSNFEILPIKITLD